MIKPIENLQVKNKRGEWVPGIEVPYYLAFGRCECRCGKRFWNEKRYREHYALEHVMGLD